MVSYTLNELAILTGSECVGDQNYVIFGVSELETAEPSEISFLSNLKYRNLLLKTKAGAVCVDRKTELTPGKNYLISDNPSKAFQTLISLFIPENSASGFLGIHPSAVIHPTAQLGKNVQIGPFVAIDRDCIIGEGTKIHSNVSIGPNVSLGENCLIYSNVTIREGSIIGNRVILQPGAVIGGCGFGYITSEMGIHNKIKHFGVVVLEDDVEIGSNATIDRARFKETRIKKGSKIDNLVMIGHNATIGDHNLIVAQAGVAGSSKTGKNVILAAQTGMVGHIEIGDQVILMAKGAFSKSIHEKGAYGGAPAVPAKEYHEQVIHTKRLAIYAARIQALEKKMCKLLEEAPC
jgi:UDP-3-O-[3-hydroxymyristoyl] glucosamine N-acyltransferase